MKLISKITATVLTVLAINGVAIAAEIAPIVYDLIPIQIKPELVNEKSQANVNDKFTPFASASPLRQLVVGAVYSANGGQEYIALGQYATKKSHGGSFVRVITLELGIGIDPIAKMNGNQLGRFPLSTTAICQNILTGQYGTCTAGQTVAGYQYVWDVTTWQKGSFTYQNTSANSPWNTMSTWITIL